MNLSCMDAALCGETLYVISNASQYPIEGTAGGCLSIYSVKNKLEPRLLSRVPHLGNTRQLVIQNNIVYIAAREDGLWMIDASDPADPRILIQYDPIEFATGIAIEGNFLYAACRNFGVEVIDISDPSAPRHAAVLRTGEAQSLFVKDSISYSGVWGTMEVVIHDVRDLSAPKELKRIPLMGRGDGVYVNDGILYAVTGQHRRSQDMHVPKQADDPSFGIGWGLEIYDVNNPEEPHFLSRLDIPEKCYYPSCDMWSVRVSGKFAYITLSWLGAYKVDVSDPEKPVIIEKYTDIIANGEPGFVDLMEPKRRAYREVRLPFDTEKELSAPVTNMALGDGVIYLTQEFSGLKCISDADAQSEHISAPEILPKNASFSPCQVHGLCFADKNRYFTACGNLGLGCYDPDSGKIDYMPVEGILRDVKRTGDLLVLAQGTAGLHLRDAETLEELGIYRDPQGHTVEQVELTPDGRFALIHVGYSCFRFIDITNPVHPLCAAQDLETAGAYCRQISNGAYLGKYLSVHYNGRGTHWYDVSGDKPVLMPWSQDNSPSFPGGIAGGRTKAICVHHGGFELFDPMTTVHFSGENVTRLEGINLVGKPFLTPDESILYVNGRIDGTVTKIDISDIKHPKLLSRISTTGNPDLMIFDGDIAVIALGYDGIMIDRP